jgi:hypothetical protein
MTTNTMVALKSVTGTGSSATLSFTSIPNTYTDLMLVVNVGLASGSTAINININGDTNNHYSMTRMYGNGSSAGSDRLSNTNTSLYSWNAYNGGTYIFNFQNYANPSVYKTIIGRASDVSNAAGAYVVLYRGLTGSSTEAIYQIDFVGSNNFATTTTATLYGIANADIGAYATGGVITQDANYYYHAFGSSSTFTPTRNLTADILVVAGGGGGGYTTGGGGGAGGIVANSAVSLANGTSYTCTIGAGGAAGTSGSPKNNGSNSNVTGGSLSLTAAVGGGAGGSGASTGNSGGSGGGGVGVNAGGSPTSGQGYAGGSGASDGSGGGGGGSGVAGTNASTGQGGAGGNGTTAYSSWLQTTGLGINVGGTYYIAAGGGGNGSGGGGVGGAGGYGGGGGGANGATPTTFANPYFVNGVANTGSGGGGGFASGGYPTGNGGSGLIIVRYAK